MSKRNQPHDRFFNKVFSNLEIIEDILTNHIPPLSDRLVPGSLEDCREKFLNPELTRYYTDLLLTAKLSDNKEALIYILLKHKSFHEPSVGFDLLRYEMQIWENLKGKAKRLPFIFPMVIYHGKQKWSSDTNFSALDDIPDGFDKYVPQFDFYLFDLSGYRDDEIKGAILSRAILLLLKYKFKEDFDDTFIHICELLKELDDKKTTIDFMRSVIEYIGSTTDKITHAQLQEGVKRVLEQDGENLMSTLFDQINEEGLKEGIEKGRGEGKLEGLLEGIELVLELKFGKTGLALLPRIQKISSIENLHNLKMELKKDISFQDLENFLDIHVP